MSHHSHNLIKSVACLRSYNSSLSSSVLILKVFTWLLRLFKWPRQDTVAPTCLTSLSKSNGPEQPYCVPRFRQNHWDLQAGKNWSQCTGHSTDYPQLPDQVPHFFFCPSFHHLSGVSFTIAMTKSWTRKRLVIYIIRSSFYFFRI